MKHWQIDFTQMPKTRDNFKFLLVFVDTFFGRVAAYPNRTKKATEVAKLLHKERIPSLDFLIALIATTDHRSLQKSPRRQDRHYRCNGGYVHLGDLDLQKRLRK